MRGDQVLELFMLICWIGNGVNGGYFSNKLSVAGKPAVATDTPSSKGDDNANNYGVHVSIFKGYNVKIVREGIRDEVILNYNDDVTIYKNKQTLVVGERIFSNKPSSMVVITNDQCMERKYSDGELIIATKMQPKDCEEIKMKMAVIKNTVQLNNEESKQSDGMDDEKTNKDVTEEEKIKSEDTEKEKTERGEDVDGDYIDIKTTNVNIRQYYVKHWVDEFGKGKVDVFGYGIKDSFFSDTYSMHNDKQLFIGSEFYSNRPNSLIAVQNGVCVERRYLNGRFITKGAVTRSECTRVKQALNDAYSYIESGAWRKDGKGNIVKNVH